MSVPTVPDVIARPGDGEVDMFGLTHPGKVRGENQDHFLVCSLRRQVRVHLTSLPNPERLDGEKQRVAFLAMVADGVGGSGKGGEASRLAVEAVTKYVTNSLYTCYAVDPADAETFSAALYDAAMQCHEEIEQLAMENRELMGMATTLTVWLGVWPKGYLLQVGDSRCYLMRDGDLMQLSRDQTMAQEL
ncbi:MAG: PP2C family protein-serine/threonine phosphatase, partial [Gemmatimonadales bacterium]